MTQIELARRAEKIVGLHFFSYLGFLLFWLINGMPTLNLKDFVIFQTEEAGIGIPISLAGFGQALAALQ